jgi:hypothetical protein
MACSGTSYKEVKVSVFIKLIRMQWARHVIRMSDELILKKALSQTESSREAREEMGGCSTGGLC